MSVDEFSSQLLIILTTFNRKKITELSVKNILESKRKATIWVADDKSSDYNKEFLASISNNSKIIIPEKKLSVEYFRFKLILQALDTNFKYVYHTDNDMIHDPNWVERLYQINYFLPEYPISLFNSTFHRMVNEQQVPELDLVVRPFCPGASFFLNQEFLTPFKEEIKNLSESSKLETTWDFYLSRIVSKPVLVSKTSYVEHFGAGGMHNNDFDRDRATTPTEYLKSIRENIISVLRDSKY